MNRFQWFRKMIGGKWSTWTRGWRRGPHPHDGYVDEDWPDSDIVPIALMVLGWLIIVAATLAVARWGL